MCSSKKVNTSGLPNANSKEKKIVPIVGRAADWRIYLQVMRLAKLLQPRVQWFAGLDRIVVRGMDK
jgi:hypothetical protein